MISPAAGRAINKRHFEHAVKKIAHLGGVIDDSIQRQKSEIDGHELGNRTQTSHSRAHRDATDGHLADGRITNAPLAKFFQKTARDPVRALPVGDFFAHHKDRFVTQHFFAQRPADRFPHSDISNCHIASSSSVQSMPAPMLAVVL